MTNRDDNLPIDIAALRKVEGNSPLQVPETVKLRCVDCGAKTVVEVHGQELWKCDACGKEYELPLQVPERGLCQDCMREPCDCPPHPGSGRLISATPITKPEPAEFRAGQWVVCTDANDANRPGLVLGGVYKLKRKTADGWTWIEGDKEMWASERFRPATPAEVGEAEKRALGSALLDAAAKPTEPSPEHDRLQRAIEESRRLPRPSPPDAVAELRERIAMLDKEATRAFAEAFDRIHALEKQLRELTAKPPVHPSWVCGCGEQGRCDRCLYDKAVSAAGEAIKRAEAAEASSAAFERIGNEAIRERDKLAAELNTERTRTFGLAQSNQILESDSKRLSAVAAELARYQETFGPMSVGSTPLQALRDQYAALVEACNDFTSGPIRKALDALEQQPSADAAGGELPARRCDHEGIGLPGCMTCDPRTVSEGGPRPDPQPEPAELTAKSVVSAIVDGVSQLTGDLHGWRELVEQYAKQQAFAHATHLQQAHQAQAETIADLRAKASSAAADAVKRYGDAIDGALKHDAQHNRKNPRSKEQQSQLQLLRRIERELREGAKP